MEEIYHEINRGGENDGLEATEVGIGYHGPNQREKRRHTHPQVDVLGSHGCRLVEFICEVHDEISSQAIKCKSLCYLHNCTSHIAYIYKSIRKLQNPKK